VKLLRTFQNSSNEWIFSLFCEVNLPTDKDPLLVLELAHYKKKRHCSPKMYTFFFVPGA
jgi:hypothetical protein